MLTGDAPSHAELSPSQPMQRTQFGTVGNFLPLKSHDLRCSVCPRAFEGVLEHVRQIT